jgi:hypothetical protein
MAYRTEEYRITQNDPNITLFDGVANIESNIARFICPDRTWIKVRPGDIFSLLAQDTTPTGVASTSVVKLIRTDPNTRLKKQLMLVDYTAVVEFTDRNKLYTIGQQATLQPKSQMLLDITANLATAYVQTRFQLSCEMMYQIEDDF